MDQLDQVVVLEVRYITTNSFRKTSAIHFKGYVNIFFNETERNFSIISSKNTNRFLSPMTKSTRHRYSSTCTSASLHYHQKRIHQVGKYFPPVFLTWLRKPFKSISHSYFSPPLFLTFSGRYLCTSIHCCWEFSSLQGYLIWLMSNIVYFVVE